MSCFSIKKKKIFFKLVLLAIVIAIVSGENHLPDVENFTCKEDVPQNEFPTDFFTIKQRKFGAIILHVILFLYAFGAIAVVCEEHFLPTIKCICKDLKLSDDVAAATFMSIATSSPELFTNIIGTFITESDIGLGHVIGNGYFDMFFVASLGGLVASQDIVLEWWPLARDCSIYFLVALTLTEIVWDGVVQTYETIILLALYVIYFFIMFNNSKIIKVISRKFKIEINDSQSNDAEAKEEIESNPEWPEREKEVKEETQPLDFEATLTLPPPEIQSLPEEENKCWKIMKKMFSVPLRTVMHYTIPDVRVARQRKYYPVAFLLCVIWIGISTYLGTWMISVIGETMGVPDLVMGMIFMAAGGSVVEAYSVYYKAKKGECSIGLSNSLGCNNLDATLCLALPWFIKTLIPITVSECNTASSNVVLGSSYIHVNCLLLVISVVILFVIFYSNGFKLNRKSGIMCGGVYVLVLIIGISIESYNEND